MKNIKDLIKSKDNKQNLLTGEDFKNVRIEQEELFGEMREK